MAMEKSFKYDCFISHSSKDKVVVRELAKKLKADGLRVWFDEWIIKPGDMIGLKIEQGLESSRTLILVMSKASFASEWVTLERHTLLFRDPTNSQRRFIPLLIEDCTIPDTIAQFAYIDWRQEQEYSFEKVLTTCSQQEKETLSSSSSYDFILEKSVLLKGHKDAVWDVSFIQNGKKAVSVSDDCTLKLWDIEKGECIATLKGHQDGIGGVATTLDGKIAVSASDDKTLKVWNIENYQCLLTLMGHKGEVNCVAITPDGTKIISGSVDRTLKVWNLKSGKCLMTLSEHTQQIWFWSVAITPDSKKVISGSWDKTLRIWDLVSGKCIAVLRGHTDNITGVAITPDGKKVISGSNDWTLKIWDLDSGKNLASLEGHTNAITGVAITHNGKSILSSSFDKTLKLWDIESGKCIVTFKGHFGFVYGIASSPNSKKVISSSRDWTLRLWDVSKFEEEVEGIGSTRYTNAKVVLLGESGVGKTGLAIRLTEDRWEKTDSTHGMNMWQLELPQKETMNIEREVWLWDFAGQPDYRLIHQLYMDETALALMVVDPQRDNPFENLGHWEKALSAAVRNNPARLMVAGRCDRGGITVSKSKLAQYCEIRGYSDFIDTAAKTGEGCKKLKTAIADNIPWQRLPWTATTILFKTLKDAIIDIKEKGIVMTRISELQQRLQLELKEKIIPEDKLRAVVGLLAGQGIIQKLDFGDFVLLQPEQINNYASAVVRCVRENLDEIGAISERKVIDAKIDFKDMKRLNEADEKILLRTMVQTFIDRSLCLREETPEGPQLIFPYYFKQDRPGIPEHPNICVTYGFSGLPEEVYTTLVVRLHYTNDFEKVELWKDAADFKSLSGKRVGLQMTKKGDERAELKVYFESNVGVDIQVSFIKYIHEHLQKRAKDVTRVRSYVCPYCDTPLENRKAIRKRLEMGKGDIICGVCEERVQLIDLIEEKFASDEFMSMVQKMDEQAQFNLDKESKELILVGHAYSIAGEAGQIFRRISASDWGIDGEIEFRNEKGEASGKRVYLQLKSGDSYLYTRKSDGKEIFTIKNPHHVEYLQNHEYPVMLVIRTSDGRIRWMNVREYLKKHGNNIRRIIFEGETFTALNLSRQRDKLFGN